MLWCCIKMLGRECPRRTSPLAELPQGSPQVVYVVADLLQFGAELRLQALTLGPPEPSGAAPLPPAGGAAAPTQRSGRGSLVASPCALASMIPRGILRQAHIYPLPQNVEGLIQQGGF